MKKIALSFIAALLICAMLVMPACAASAYPNQRLSFRTGPNTRYTEMVTLPQSTHIIPLEYEQGNGVTWVLCEFTYNGKTCRGYTGLKRMSISGSIPWADHEFGSGYMLQASNVYTAPSGNAAVRGKVGTAELVTYLCTENGYDFIEFYDAKSGAPSRGWVPTSYLDLSDVMGAFMLESSNVYAEPSSKSQKVGKVGKYEMVGYVTTTNSYDLIVFYSASRGDLYMGYVPTSIVDAYGY